MTVWDGSDRNDRLQRVMRKFLVVLDMFINCGDSFHRSVLISN